MKRSRNKKLVLFLILILLLPREDNFQKYAFFFLFFSFQDNILFSLSLTVCLPWV